MNPVKYNYLLFCCLHLLVSVQIIATNDCLFGFLVNPNKIEKKNKKEEKIRKE